MFLQGILLGFSLSFMVGPLLFSLLQAALSGGMRAGLATALGTWISDFIFIFLILYGLDQLSAMTAQPGFKFWAGVAGGCVLLLFGLGSLWSRARALQMSELSADLQKKQIWTWFLRGFLMNTINPFTVFFWLGLAGGFILPNSWSNSGLVLFFGGMMGTLIFTDCLKIYLAKRISELMTVEHVSKAKWMMGWLLIIFGFVLIVRVW